MRQGRYLIFSGNLALVPALCKGRSKTSDQERFPPSLIHLDGEGDLTSGTHAPALNVIHMCRQTTALTARDVRRLSHLTVLP